MLSNRSNQSMNSLRTKLIGKEGKNGSAKILLNNQNSFLLPEKELKHCEPLMSIDPIIINKIKKPNQSSKIIDEIKKKCLIDASSCGFGYGISQKENNSLQQNTQSKFKDFISNVTNTINHDSTKADKRYNISRIKDNINKSTSLIDKDVNKTNKKELSVLYPEKAIQNLTSRSKGNKDQIMALIFGYNKNEGKEFSIQSKQMEKQSNYSTNQYDTETKTQQKRIIPNSSFAKLSQLKYQLEKTPVNLPTSTQPKVLTYSKSQKTLSKTVLRFINEKNNEAEIKEFESNFNR